MRTYNTLPINLWALPDYRQLSEDARVLLFYLGSNAHTNMLGCYHLPISYMVEDLLWSNDRVSRSLVQLTDSQLAAYDKAYQWVFVKTFLEWSPVSSSKQGMGLVNQLDQVPAKVSFYPELSQHIQHHCRHLPAVFQHELALHLKAYPSLNPSVSIDNDKPINNLSIEDAKVIDKVSSSDNELTEAQPPSEASIPHEIKPQAVKSAKNAEHKTDKDPYGDTQEEYPIDNLSIGYRYQEQEPEQEQGQEQEQSTCAELAKNATSTPTSDVVITLPLVGNKEWAVHQAQVDEWQQLYPGIDVVQALRNIKGWNVANPKRRKTKSGILRHVMSWLAKEQDRGGIGSSGVAIAGNGFPRAPGKHFSLHEYNLESGRQWLAQRRVINGEASVCN